MCESSRNGGIASREGAFVDSRLLSDGGFEAWDFIRKARDEVWEKSGLDSNALYCPETAEEINFERATHPPQPSHSAQPPHSSNESYQHGEHLNDSSSPHQQMASTFPDFETDLNWSALWTAADSFWPDETMPDVPFDYSQQP